MKLLVSIDSEGDANRIKTELTTSGIPCRVFGPQLYNATDIQIWILIDSQFEDARKLLENPDHVVSDPVNVNEFFNRLDNIERKQANRYYDKFMLTFLLIVLVLIAAYTVFINS